MTLVRLKLEFGHSFGVSVPHTVCLPNLKFLHLRHIVFSDDESVQRLFSAGHMLEELLLRHCSQKTPGKFMFCSPTLKRLILTSFTDCEELMINAPNLVYFEHSDFVVTHYSLLNLHSLVEARIDVGLFTVAFFYQTAAPDLLRVDEMMFLAKSRSMQWVKASHEAIASWWDDPLQCSVSRIAKVLAYVGKFLRLVMCGVCWLLFLRAENSMTDALATVGAVFDICFSLVAS
ncbi:hypothetical protein J1N35_044760 [Gossypium stocksii]|uniref:F-box/LRR-repeat protein 15/At3g58940/PEG3-like LRR domain-containing protein n=1 Tax=Gossypium stocksii TaxID=47602 RepID=A0A9D3ZGE1_9ROSI|nr:hypothetical protein J1N35_044760 [Gossypium stocksii]